MLGEAGALLPGGGCRQGWGWGSVGVGGRPHLGHDFIHIQSEIRREGDRNYFIFFFFNSCVLFFSMHKTFQLDTYPVLRTLGR